MPVIEASPPKEQGTEGSGPISLTGQPTQVRETEVVTTDDEHEAAIFHSQRLGDQFSYDNCFVELFIVVLQYCFIFLSYVVKGEHGCCRG